MARRSGSDFLLSPWHDAYEVCPDFRLCLRAYVSPADALLTGSIRDFAENGFVR